MPIERKHRLPAAAYIGRRSFAFTACTEDRKTFLADADVVSACVQLLERQSAKYECLIPIYCFMPDHLHLLMQGISQQSRPKLAMDEFKRLTGTWLAENRPSCSWQSNYYDHMLRRDEDWKKQAFYILNNPVRRGLAENGYAYPFTGSIGYDLEELLADLAWS